MFDKLAEGSQRHEHFRDRYHETRKSVSGLGGSGSEVWLTVSITREGLKDCRKGLGTCESNHRMYTYRMKKQGRRWSYRGGLAMIKVISGLKNDDLEQALAGDLRGIPMKTRKEYRDAVREALKKPVFVSHVGAHQCMIANYGPSSSPMGHLAAALSW